MSTTSKGIRTVGNDVFQQHITAMEQNYALFQRFVKTGDPLSAITTQSDGMTLAKKWPDAFVYVARLHGADPDELISTLQSFPQTPQVIAALQGLGVDGGAS